MNDLSAWYPCAAARLSPLTGARVSCAAARLHRVAQASTITISN